MLGFFQKQPLLDEATSKWMFDSFAWALRNFDAKVFDAETILVTPTNEHFPGSSRDAHEMAQLIFDRVKFYAGLSHWPCLLASEHEAAILSPNYVTMGAPMRRGKALMDSKMQADNAQFQLVIPYQPQTIQAPEVLISHFAHILAHYLGTQTQEAPPGGEENWPHVTELLAVFLGFGLMMANTAYTTKIRSCTSCSGPAIERTNFLSQYDITYALAIFAALKGIPQKTIVPHLKSTLRAFYKKAFSEVSGKTADIAMLQSIS